MLEFSSQRTVKTKLWKETGVFEMNHIVGRMLSKDFYSQLSHLLSQCYI